MHHIPDWLISLSAKLALNFQCRKALLGRSHQMNGPEPILEGQFGGFHYGSTPKGGASPARFTLKLTNALHPVMVGSFTLATDDTFLQTIVPEIVPARLFVGKLSCEIDKLHNRNVDPKLHEHDVTYLRFGSS